MGVEADNRCRGARSLPMLHGVPFGTVSPIIHLLGLGIKHALMLAGPTSGTKYDMAGDGSGSCQNPTVAQSTVVRVFVLLLFLRSSPGDTAVRLWAHHSF